VWANGYGFPVGQGGPMFWAELVGLAKIVERLDEWYGRTGKEVYNPSPLLRKLAASGGSFADAGKAAE
jgi:3-hydroxyacyl-CoA dehydrogenase